MPLLPSRVCSGSVGGKRDSCVRCFLVVFPSFEIVTNLIKKGKRWAKGNKTHRRCWRIRREDKLAGVGEKEQSERESELSTHSRSRAKSIDQIVRHFLCMLFVCVARLWPCKRGFNTYVSTAAVCGYIVLNTNLRSIFSFPKAQC